MKKSKIGITLISIYLALTIISFLSANTCEGFLCQAIIFLPTMPWLLILEDAIWDSDYLYTFLIILNSIILYSIGYLLSLIAKKTKFFR